VGLKSVPIPRTPSNGPHMAPDREIRGHLLCSVEAQTAMNVADYAMFGVLIAVLLLTAWIVFLWRKP
jgi:hypothetical protein